MNDSLVLGQSVHNPSADFEYPKVLLDAPAHPDSLALIEIWRACEAKGGMRMGRDIPSRTLGRFLPNILISEPDADWKDAYGRLAGSTAVARFGRDITGMKLSELYPDRPEDVAIFMGCAHRADEAREPQQLDTRVLAGRSELMRYEIVFLPIYAADGVTHLTMLGTFRF